MTTGKLLKLTYWLFGSLVALLLLASVAIGFLDWNQYRGTLSDLASSRLGMRVELAGRVSVGLFPRPEVSAETVRLYPAGDAGADFVATADRIDMRLGFGALLKGDVAIQHLGFDGLNVVVEEDSEGAWNVRGWPKSESDADAPATSVQMERLKIVGGTVQLVDNQGVSRTLEGLSFDLKGRLPEGPLEWDGSFVSAGQKVTSSGRLRPSRDDSVLSFKTDIGMAGGNLHISGRLFDDGFAGRIQTEGDNLASFVAASQAVTGNTEVAPSVPEMPFELDVQVDREAGVYRAISRTLDVGGTRGRLDLTVARRNGGFHAAGSASFGILVLAPWLDAQANTVPVEAVELNTPSKTPITGAIDLTVEGIQVGNGVIQQLDAVVRLTDEGVQLTNLQALLPGGSGLFFSGALMASKGQGNLQIVSGNLPDLLRWMQIDVSGRIPPGRLATGELSANISIAPDKWRLSALEARVDTSNFEGDVTGKTGSVWPESVRLAADTLNLDAYVSDTSGPGTPDNLFDTMPPQPIAIEMIATEVLWGGARYSNLRAMGEVGPEQLRLSSLSVRNAGGKLELAGRLRKVGDKLEIEGDATLAKWGFPAVQALSDDVARYLQALGLSGVNGTLSVAGPLEAMRVSAKLSEGRGRSLSLSGGIGYGSDVVKIEGVQGTLAHEDLSRLAALEGYTLAGKVPADLTFAVGDSETGARSMTLSGTIAGGQLLAEGSQTDSRQEWRLSFDHKHAGDVLKLLDQEGQLPHPGEPIRARAKVTLRGSAWDAQDLDIRNGPARFAGNLSRGADNKMAGKLVASGFTYNPPLGRASGQAPATKELAIDQSLFDMAGKVDVALDQVEILGQKVSAPNASLIAGDGSLRFALGDDAMVNGGASAFTLNLIGGNALSLSGTANISEIDIGAMLKAEGLAAALQGVGSLSFSFDGQGDSLDAILRTLKGRGEMKGRAGSLNFLSVPTLVREMGNAPSATVFLGSVGKWLREGSTSFSEMEARFTLDAGTMLLEELAATGAWGQFGLDGQINFRDAFLNLKGTLALSTPPDTPAIPVEYSGPLDNPSASWASRALERFVIAGIERRLRSTLAKDLQKIQGDQQAANPGAEVFSRAFDLLGRLKAKQEAKKNEGDEGEATEPSPKTEGQKP
ncbi:AsmA family protein [Kordiimonas lacus]|uniref:AsmA family protein n=1 Tax=Kordiimonas lacus TaxID=637679 RepID=A0A1G7D8K8_9PROT|nr:AsmA family protein [Kordiimonas lacus]SDE47968.1 AsmA family protein [Kordiimonas lacus]